MSANGIEVLELLWFVDMVGNVLHHTLESFERFCGLRKQANALREVKTFGFFNIFNNNSFALSLSHKPKHFGMSALTVDNDLLVVG